MIIQRIYRLDPQVVKSTHMTFNFRTWRHKDIRNEVTDIANGMVHGLLGVGSVVGAVQVYIQSIGNFQCLRFVRYQLFV